MGMSMGLIGAGGALAGLFGGGGANSVQLPPQFNMPNMGGAAQNAYGGIGNLDQYTQLGSSMMPYAQNTFQGLYNNPYAGGAQAGANTASGLGMNAALGAYGAGGNLMGAGMMALPAAGQIMQTGFDPQQALYNRTAQQTQDQSLAGLAATGMATSPYGAGVEGQTMANFNIDWQNQQLGRQATAAGAAGGLLGAGGNAINMGAGIMNTAPGQYAGAAAMPYATSMGIGGGQNQAIQSMLGLGQGAQGLANTQIQDYLAYLGVGNQAGGVANQQAALALQQQNQGFNQNMQLGNMLGRSIYGIGQGYGGGGFGGSPLFQNMFGGGVNYNPGYAAGAPAAYAQYGASGYY